MTNRADILEALADRVEKANAEQQASFLIEAFDLVDWRSRNRGRVIEHNPRWFRFDKMIRAEAYESAAMTLLPDNCQWTIEPDSAWVRWMGSDVEEAQGHLTGRNGKCTALALCAACLRAQAMIERERSNV